MPLTKAKFGSTAKGCAFGDPREAQAAGIATIYQELDLVPSLDVAANLFLGHEILRNGFLNSRAMREEARKRLSAIDLDIDIDRRVADLSIGHRQVVAIVKALSSASRVLIMDEPTAALTSAEVDRLLKIMRDLSAKGVGIIYISHRLEEVPRVADRVTVMRDGLVAGVTAPKAPQAEIVQLLVGRPLGELYPQRAGKPGRRLLNLEHARFRLTRERAGWQAPEDVTLRVHAGEIVGLAGVMGAGRTELLSALYGSGLEGRWQGVVEVAGAPAKLASIRAARRAGARLRHRRPARQRPDAAHGGRPQSRDVDPPTASRRSASFPAPGRRPPRERSYQQFDIRPHDPRLAAGALSGGNQQKVGTRQGSSRRTHVAAARRTDARRRRRREGRDLRAPARTRAARVSAFSSRPAKCRNCSGLCDRIVVLRGGRTVAEFEAGVDEADGAGGGVRRGDGPCLKSARDRRSLRSSTAKTSPPRIDLLAIAVRFQSLIGLVLVAIGGVIFSPVRHGHILFLAPDNIANIIRAISETGIIAVGMTFVIITAGIDLSVGALLSLSSVLTATMMVSVGWGLLPTLLAVLAVGAAFGAMQGSISTRFRLEPFIVTLAGLQVARGLALVVSNNQYINISYGDGPGLAPPIFAILGDRLFSNTVPVATLVFVVLRGGGDDRAQHHAFRPLRVRRRRQRARRAAFGRAGDRDEDLRLRDHRPRLGGGRHRPCRPVQFRQRQRRHRL